MCGIYACIARDQPHLVNQEFQDCLNKRGPDHTGQAVAQCQLDDMGPISVNCTSTVLALRGGHITTQPFLDPSTQSLFCWNGEAWRFGDVAVSGNDGQVIFNALMAATHVEDKYIAKGNVLNVLRSISGPFAFFYYDNVHKQVYFGRDRLGRRSLLYRHEYGSLEIASIAHEMSANWQEIEADGIYHQPLSDCLSSNDELPSHDFMSPFNKSQYPWDSDVLTSSLGTFNKTLPSGTTILDVESQAVFELHKLLAKSLRPRILSVPPPPAQRNEHNVRVAVLFSGGLDCTVLARMAHDILPLDQQIDLINVAFENPRVVQAARNAAKPRARKSQRDEGVASFEHTIETAQTPEPTSPFESCPDRETGRKAHQELVNSCPGRKWRLVAVNVPYTEFLSHRDMVIRLIYPHNTEMDLSIACALYFASRGIGISSDQEGGIAEHYVTPARVLLSGLGADELFGGYTRHSTAFNRHGYQGLIDELELDVNRLGKRNLGRDDRVISHWSKEARFPYLDEALVKWAVERPIWEKCGFTTDQVSDELGIEPEKKVLRLLAYSLGMHSVAHEKKRAIQFGARTAKMEVGRTKGTQAIS